MDWLARYVCHNIRVCLLLGGLGVFIEEGPDRDDLSAKLNEKNFIPVWMEPELVTNYIFVFLNFI